MMVCHQIPEIQLGSTTPDVKWNAGFWTLFWWYWSSIKFCISHGRQNFTSVMHGNYRAAGGLLRIYHGITMTYNLTVVWPRTTRAGENFTRERLRTFAIMVGSRFLIQWYWRFRNPKQAPGMNKALQIIGYLPYQLDGLSWNPWIPSVFFVKGRTVHKEGNCIMWTRFFVYIFAW